MLLLIADDALHGLADDLIAEPSVIRSAKDQEELEVREETFAVKRRAFIAAARLFIG